MTTSNRGAEQSAKRTCLIAGLVGMLFGIMVKGLRPNAWVYPDSIWTGFPLPVALFMKFIVRANEWPWVIITASVVIFEILRVRFQKRAWVLAGCLGLWAGSLMIEAMRFLASA